MKHYTRTNKKGLSINENVKKKTRKRTVVCGVFLKTWRGGRKKIMSEGTPSPF